jgi:DNA-binding response OmpR family regulator
MTAILIAEDDLLSQRVLTATLTKLGHGVTVVSNGREAWEALESRHYPILITDWVMPEMDGLELCRALRAARRPKYTYVLLLTALDGKENYLHGMDAGADDYLTKPFELDQLRARLRVAERVIALQEEVRTLSGLLPICSYCKKIRDDQQQWTSVESYVSKRTDALFSHGVCPTCYENTVKPQLEALKRRPRTS